MFSNVVSILLLSAAAQSPSFDCTRAKSVSEILICKHPELSQLDREIAEAYAGARYRLDSVGDAALLKEQSLFLNLRDAVIDPDYRLDAEAARERITEVMQSRRDFLLKIKKPGKAVGLTGKWGNYFNDLSLTRISPNRVSVSGGGADPYFGRWVCDIDDVATLQGKVLKLDGTDGTEGSILTFTRNGDMLKVTEKLAVGSATTPYCGHRGSFEGVYFLIG